MLKFVTAFLVLAVPVYCNADMTPTHCNGDETIYFNCLIKGSKKVASVCGAGYKVPVLSIAEQEEHNKKNTMIPSESGYLQYRFGLIGNQEFKYPSTTDKDDMKDRFNFSGDRSAEYDYYDMALQFSNDNYSYIVYSGVEIKNQTGKEFRKYSSSITVWKLKEPCPHSKCPPRAPHAAPEGKIVKVFTCSNGNAGKNIFSVGGIISLTSSPGRSGQVTLPFPSHINQ